MGGCRLPATPAPDSDRQRPTWHFLEDVSKPVQVDVASSPQPLHPLTSLPTPPPSLPQLHRSPPGLRHKTYGDPGFQTPRLQQVLWAPALCTPTSTTTPPFNCRWPPPPPGAWCHRTPLAGHAISEAKAHRWPQIAHVEPPPLINRSRA